MWCDHCRSIWPHKGHKHFILSIFHFLVGEFDVDKLTAVELNMKETKHFPNDLSNVFFFFPLTSKISRLSYSCKGEKLFRSCVCFAALIQFPPPLHSKHLQLDPVATKTCDGHPCSKWALWDLSFCIEFFCHNPRNGFYFSCEKEDSGAQKTWATLGAAFLSLKCKQRLLF